MGFLDDLKRRAEAAKARQTVDVATLERHVRLADAACRTVSTYLHSLAQQLNVLMPESPLAFELDARHVARGLRLCDFRADARLGRFGTWEVFDHVAIGWRLRSGEAFQIDKDFPVDWERLEARLAAGGVQCAPEPVRHPDTGKLAAMRYAFVADFHGWVRVVPEHEHARLRFTLHDLEPFETLEASFPATEVGTERLDELARWIVGEPQRFLDGAHEVRRTLV